MKTVAILGYGGRGRMYALLLRLFHRKQARVVAVIDNDVNKLQLAQKENKLPDNCLYDSYNKNQFPQTLSNATKLPKRQHDSIARLQCVTC